MAGLKSQNIFFALCWTVMTLCTALLCPSSALAADINGTSNNDIFAFTGTLQSVATTLTNPYSLQSVTVNGIFFVNNASYDGLGGTDTLFMTNNGDYLVLDHGGVQMLFNIERIIAGDGGDVINMASASMVLGNMLIDGGLQGDIIWGNSGNDTLRGSDGNDIVDGGPGNDIILGQNGNDTLSGGAGNDVLDGGSGVDTASYAGSPSGVTVNLATGTASDGYGGTDTLADIENVIGSSWNDTITGNANANMLDGGLGMNHLYGDLGVDTAVFSFRTIADFEVTRLGPDSFVVKDRIDPANVSYLYGIEFAKFTDRLLDLTTDQFVPVVANAGLDQTAQEGALVTLDGSLSTGPSLSYAWTQLAGPVVALSGAATAHPSFTAPHVSVAGATLTFKLIVTGSDGRVSNPDTVDVHVTNINQPPVAEAGVDQTVQEGSSVVLDGSASYDPDFESLTYHWVQVSGTPVALGGDTTANPTFIAPTVGQAGVTLVFALTVIDPHGATSSDSVSIMVTNVNHPPTANAGSDQTVNEHASVILNGMGSSDPDLDALSYAWTQTSGPSVVLVGADTSTPTFTAPSVSSGGATLTFQLVVSDGQATSAADAVDVHVLDTNDPPVCSFAQPSVASLWPPNHAMVPVSILGVSDPNNEQITFTYTAVTQDEPVNGLGDGDMSPDAAVAGQQILLRAERAGTGNGRVYEVRFMARDAQGASCSGSVKIGVPHSKKDTAIEGPQLYNSFAP